MKDIGKYEDLLERLYKEKTSLEDAQSSLDEVYEQWMTLDKELNKLEGSIQAIEHIAYGKHTTSYPFYDELSESDTSNIPGVDISDQGPGLYPEGFS